MIRCNKTVVYSIVLVSGPGAGCARESVFSMWRTKCFNYCRHIKHHSSRHKRVAKCSLKRCSLRQCFEEVADCGSWLEMRESWFLHSFLHVSCKVIKYETPRSSHITTIQARP